MGRFVCVDCDEPEAAPLGEDAVLPGVVEFPVAVVRALMREANALLRRGAAAGDRGS